MKPSGWGKGRLARTRNGAMEKNSRIHYQYRKYLWRLQLHSDWQSTTHDPQLQNRRVPELIYYSYDSLGNPWCSGGGARRDFEVLSRHAASGWKVRLIVGYFPGFKPTRKGNFSIEALGYGRSNAVSRLLFAICANLHALKALGTRAKVAMSFSAFAPILTPLLLGRRCTAILHHAVGREAFGKFGWLGAIPFACEWICFRWLRRAMVSNASVIEKLRQQNPRLEAMVTGNAVDENLFATTPSQAIPPYVLYLGRFDIEMKGLDILLTAFSLLAENRSDIRLVMAGFASPERIEAVRHLIPERLAQQIELRINVTSDDKKKLLSECLFFCSPSRFEGFGIAALEASACGKAVLVTDTDGFRASTVHEKTGLMVPSENVEALWAAMSRLCSDASLRETLGRNGRLFAGGFRWDEIAAKERDFLAAG
jgi:glycosyltransferase involved in cell wall biosynthesis